MTHKSDRAGKSTRAMAKKRRLAALWIGLAGITALVVIYLLVETANWLGIGGAGILVLILLMRVIRAWTERRVERKLKEEKRAIRGAKAEEKIGELLAGLSEEYYVLHDVESPYGNIDHIVIGKTQGVFLIETKAHGGKVQMQGGTLLVNGKLPEKDFIAQALKNAYWLREKISAMVGLLPWVTPILVFTNAFVVPARPVKGVYIINKKYLVEMLQRAGRPGPVAAQIWEQREKIGGLVPVPDFRSL
jgi:hypothetical protein